MNQYLMFLLASFILLLSKTNALDNGLAKTPPMGWMTWERFRCNVNCDLYPKTCISEDLIVSTAFAMKEMGFISAGYQYLIIDDCWLNKSRSSNGSLIPDPVRFPNGMGYIGDILHYIGLKFGLYEDFGTMTCAGYPGSLNDMAKDIATFVGWKVDYIKLDGCYSNVSIQPTGYAAYESLLNKSGRPIVFSCSWPAYFDVKNIDPIKAQLLQNSCNLWRMYDDIDDSWNSVLGIINYYKENVNNFSTWAGPGHWNDPDMLIIGNAGLTFNQQRVQMGMWAIFAAPLIMSNDLRNISSDSVKLLQNKNIIAIDQDPLGSQGTFWSEKDGIQIWKRNLSGNMTVFAVLNTTPTSVDVSVTLLDVGFKDGAREYVIKNAFTMDFSMTVTNNIPINFKMDSTSIEMVMVQ